MIWENRNWKKETSQFFLLLISFAKKKTSSNKYSLVSLETAITEYTEYVECRKPNFVQKLNLNVRLYCVNHRDQFPA